MFVINEKNYIIIPIDYDKTILYDDFEPLLNIIKEIN